MQEHDVQTVVIRETNIFKDIEVEYDAKYFYCDIAEEYYADEDMLSENDISMKNSYRKKSGLLTSREIIAIRSQYDISQGDLCTLLGWGAKTITRYEGHQVQDMAHDTILRKLEDDPAWFIALLEKNRALLSAEAYNRYYKKAAGLFEQKHDAYLRKSIEARYSKFSLMNEYNGNVPLSLDKVVDVINYFANAKQLLNLYKVKLMKLLWYADALSYKRRGHAITGLVYQALPMGAVPVAHDLIIDLQGIEYEEIMIGDGMAYRFVSNEKKEYKTLSETDIDILDEIIRAFSAADANSIVRAMHGEQAYKNTAARDIIEFKYSDNLSID